MSRTLTASLVPLTLSSALHVHAQTATGTFKSEGGAHGQHAGQGRWPDLHQEAGEVVRRLDLQCGPHVLRPRHSSPGWRIATGRRRQALLDLAEGRLAVLVAMMAAVLGLNALGDGLRRELDPVVQR